MSDMRGDPITAPLVGRISFRDYFGNRLARHNRGGACYNTSGAQSGTQKKASTAWCDLL